MNSTPFASELDLLKKSLAELEYHTVLKQVSQRCFSTLGIEIITNLAPMDNADMLREELQRTEEVRTLFMKNETLPLDGFDDIRPQLHKSFVSNAYLTPSELLKILDAIRVSRMVAAYFRQNADIYPSMAKFTSFLHENRFLEHHISDAVDETGHVRDSASRELAAIRREILETSARLRNRIKKILAKVIEDDLAMEEYVTQRDGRYVLPIKNEFKRQIPGIIHGVSQTGGTVFLEPTEIFEANNQLSLLFADEEREIIRILTTLTGEVGGEARQFLHSVETLGYVEVICAKARYATERGGIKPTINDENYIEIRNIVHPLLILPKGQKPVPLSIEFTQNERGHLISGPNAGGKTVALKSIGLNIAMALSGIFPLGELSTNIRTIFSAIGDHQSIENNLSTFSSQIVRLREILSHCSSQTLVLVDEICSGTDPHEGSALAAGILDSMIERNVFFVVTTHQSSLKSYALSRPEIRNASMQFDEYNLAPTYKFLSGIPGNSYAFALAHSVGIPQHILDKALVYLGDRHSELEKSIAALQRYKIEAEASARAAAVEHEKAERIRKDYEQRNNDFKQKKGEVLQQARQQASDIVSRANILVEQTVREIREQQKAATEIKREFDKAKESIQRDAEKHRHREIASDSKANEIKQGDAVMMNGSNEVGVAIVVHEESSSAIVEFNGLKFKTALANLFPAPKSKQKEAIKRNSTGGFIKFDAKATLDVRGQRAEECIKELEIFISDAVVTNLETLTIIHGKGTGALRTAIHDHLRKHPSVKSYRNGAISEGGEGVTIIEIR